jgi:hypothetical protein
MRDTNVTLPTSLVLVGKHENKWPGDIYIYEAQWAPITYHIPDDEERDGPRKVGFFYISHMADCLSSLY